MDLTVSKTDLNRALQIAQSAVAKKTTMPILVNLLLTAENGMLKICASDLEMSILALVKADIASEGGITVNTRILTDIVKELPEGDVKISVTEGERIEIVAKSSKFRVIGLSAEEYPSVPGLAFEAKNKISAKLLGEMISKTIYAVSLDETRFNLNGVCFEIVSSGGPKIVRKDRKSGKDSTSCLRLVATDGHRLSMITRPASDIDFDGRLIVPRKGLMEMRRILEGEPDEEIGIAVQEGFFLLETKLFKIAVRMIDGEYPDYSQVIPKEAGVVAVMKSSDLLTAIRRVVLVTTDKEKCARMTFSPNSLRITSSSPELGDANEEVSIKYDGEVFTTGFNAQYLADVAAAFAGEDNLMVELHGELGPGKFYLENDDSALAIVMPMRL